MFHGSAKLNEDLYKTNMYEAASNLLPTHDWILKQVLANTTTP